MATAKKRSATKKAAVKIEPPVDWKFQMQEITDRLDIMIQQLDAVRQHLAPPKAAKK